MATPALLRLCTRSPAWLLVHSSVSSERRGRLVARRWSFRHWSEVVYAGAGWPLASAARPVSGDSRASSVASVTSKHTWEG